MNTEYFPIEYKCIATSIFFMNDEEMEKANELSDYKLHFIDSMNRHKCNKY